TAGTDRLVGDQHVDGIRVKLREVAKGKPTALGNRQVESQIVQLPVGFDFARGGDLAVDDDFDEPFAATEHFLVAWAVQIDRVADDLTTGWRRDTAVSDG